MIITLLWGIGVILLVEGAAYIVAPSLIERIGALMALAGSSLLYLIRFL